MPDPRNVRWDIAALVVAAIGAFVWLSLLTHDPADPLPPVPKAIAGLYQPDIIAFPPNEQIQNACGASGAWLSHLLFQALGVGAYLAGGLLGLSVVVMLRRTPWASPLGRSFGWTLVGLSLVTLLPMIRFDPGMPVPIGAGGYLGAMTSTWLHENFAFFGGLVLILTCLAAGILLSTEYAVLRYLGYSASGLAASGKQLGLPMAWLVRQAVDKATATRPAVGRSDLPNSLTMANRESEEEASTDDEGPSIIIGRKPIGERTTEIAPINPNVAVRTDIGTTRSLGVDVNKEAPAAPNRTNSSSFISSLSQAILGGKKGE